MAARIEPLMTVDDLDAMPEDGNRYEVIEGELFVARAPGVPHQIVSGNFHYQIGSYLETNPIGTIVATPGLIRSKFSGVIPDLIFYTHARGEEIIADNRLIAAPDIVIEIFRPDARISRVTGSPNASCTPRTASKNIGSPTRKIGQLKSIGSTNKGLELSAMFRLGDEITSPLLPGFSSPVSRIFEE